MCNFASFVLTKDSIFWCDESDSHEDIISENSLHADGVAGPNVLRVEVSPTKNVTDLMDFASWQYKVDQDIMPGWFDAVTCETRTREALQERFKRGLKVGGSLSLCGCTGLKELPNGLTVGGDLSLDGCTGLKALPDGLKVGGYLCLDGCTGLKTLPDVLKVGGSLSLDGCTGLKTLPDVLKVGGDLLLDGCTGLKALPDGLKVSGGLSLNGCTGLKALPKGLKVGGNLYGWKR
jgi:hypothetical protein